MERSEVLRVGRWLSCQRTWMEVCGGAERCLFWILSLWRRCAVGDWDRVSGGWTHNLLETAGGAREKEPTCKSRSPEFHSWFGGFPRGGHSSLSSTLACRTPWTEEPGRLQSMESQRHDWSDSADTLLLLCIYCLWCGPRRPVLIIFRASIAVSLPEASKQLLCSALFLPEMCWLGPLGAELMGGASEESSPSLSVFVLLPESRFPQATSEGFDSI